MSFKPLGDRVLLLPDDPATVSPGGIVLPDISKKHSENGTVMAVGPGRAAGSGKSVPVRVKVGDHVMFTRFGGTELEVDGQNCKLLREDDILGVFATAKAKAKKS